MSYTHWGQEVSLLVNTLLMCKLVKMSITCLYGNCLCLSSGAYVKNSGHCWLAFYAIISFVLTSVHVAGPGKSTHFATVAFSAFPDPNIYAFALISYRKRIKS